MTVRIVGLDLAKDVFQVHGVSETGRKVFNKKIKRAKLLAFFETLPRCIVGMEACGSAHHWGRVLRKVGHDVRLMPAAYVKPYVKRGKTDAADAEAICEAVQRPTMRFVEIKSEEQQAVLAIHRSRDLIVRQRTQVVNMIRSILHEFGHILLTGIEAVSKICPGSWDRRSIGYA
jgi:transposase